MIVIAVKLRVFVIYRNEFVWQFSELMGIYPKKKILYMPERWDEISSLSSSSLRIFVGVLFGLTGFTRKLEIQARNGAWDLYKYIANKMNYLEGLISMYSEKCLCA